MSVLPFPLPNTDSSLFLHISSVPRINKTQFISSYVQEQRIHAKTYAAEGRALERSWKQEEVHTPMSDSDKSLGIQKTSKLVMDIGFGTPVLKPRELKRLDGNTEILQTKDKILLNVENVMEKRVSKQKRKRKQRQPSGPRKGSSVYGSEKEYEQRLEERRERKRVKRAVMKSASNVSSNESSAEGTKGKDKKTKKTAKNIGLAGLALMHGFTATNVGKGRLTVKPSLNVGVFNKGKASSKSRPMQRNKKLSKKAGRISGGFIEDEFLSKTSKGLRKRRATWGSNSETLSSLSSRTKAKNSQKLQKTMRSASDSSPASTEIVRETIRLDDKKPTASITWDIERESAILPSHLSTSISDPEKKAISVLVDTKNTLWSKDALHDAPLLDCQGPVALHLMTPSNDTEPSHGSPSVGPSESASQRVNLSPTRYDRREAASRYFVSGPQPQTAEEQSPSEGVTGELESREVVIKPLAHGFTHTDEKHDLSLALSSDVIAAQVQDEKKNAGNILYDSLLYDLDDLPFVEPQDYKYSDYNYQTGPSEDLNCDDEVLRAVIPSYNKPDDERTQNDNFFTPQLDVLELAFPLEPAYPEEVEPTVYEEQKHNQEESLDDDEYDALDREAEFSLSSRVLSEIWNRSVIDNTDWNLEELGFNLWQGIGEVNSVDSSNSVNLDTCINSDLEPRESVDLIGTFTEGKALLCGYSDAEACALYSSVPRRQIQVSAAEADVAKRLKNHWLPQRL